MSLSSAAKASALDFQGFAALRQVSRERAEEGATLVARQFEGIILQTMLRTMRQGLPGDPLSEAITALQALGYKPAEAERMARKAATDGDDAAIIIRKALQSALR